ncbi:hypothetical protein MKZ38_010570 [Zalerion maritima]|uniref:Uncharacterized protein n=1 Tax=Zalerion maritima TaxID=339359 RepID=A0AAD5RTI1_9PEZI|nr:hypothetical protein MKZ38_010570 [Zalerion maritima]
MVAPFGRTFMARAGTARHVPRSTRIRVAGWLFLFMHSTIYPAFFTLFTLLERLCTTALAHENERVDSVYGLDDRKPVLNGIAKARRPLPTHAVDEMLKHAFLHPRNDFGSSGSSDGSGDFSGFNFGSSQTNSNGAAIYQTAESTDSNSTDEFDPLAVIRAAQFSAAKSIRTSTIILAVFNTIAAFATTGFLSFVSSPDLFPLIVSGSITIQGIVFSVAQSRGLDGLSGSGCTLISQFMLPALLLVPTTQFVLGCELLLRGVKSQPFQERGRWMVPICLAIVGLITLVNFLVADFLRVDDKCFMSLFWFVSDYAVGIFILLAAYGALLLGTAIFLFVKLTRMSKIEPTERVNASRMIYFLALAVLSNAFMCPFFFVLGFMKTRWGEGPANALNLSMIAAVVASVSGLMTGGLHLFLRSSSISTIGPKNKWEEDERLSLKKKIRVRGFTSVNDHGMDAVSGYGYGNNQDGGASFEDYNKAEDARKGATSPAFTIDAPNPLRSNAVDYPQVATAVQVPQPVQIGKSHLRKTSNYSLFPRRETKASMALLPSTTYNPDIGNNSSNTLLTVPNGDRSTIRPPPSVRSHLGRHRRDSSMASHATVQIGLRLSNVENMPDINPKFIRDDDKVHHLDCPLAIQAAREREEARRPSPLSTTHTQSDASDEDIVASRALEVQTYMPQRDPVKDARMKTLPPVPIPGQSEQLENREEEEEEEITLSPTVYTPQSPTSKAKLPSPRGVGFTTPARGPNASNSQPPTPTNEQNGKGAKRSQWI